MIQQLKFLTRPILIKSIVIFGLLVTTYLGFMKYSEYRIQEQVSQMKSISGMRMNLVQSRASWVALARLDPESPDLFRQKTDLISQIRKSIDQGSKSIETEEICKRQQEALDELFKKNTFDEGIEFLHSDKVVQILTDMTNLIYTYEFREGQIREHWKLNQ